MLSSAHRATRRGAADFEISTPVAAPIDRVRFHGAAEYFGDSTLAPIRTDEDEEREASRDDMRVHAIVLDDHHVRRQALTDFPVPAAGSVRTAAGSGESGLPGTTSSS